MGLQERLDAIKAASAKKIDPRVWQDMREATLGLVGSKILETTCRVGDRAPEFSLTDATGAIFNSADVLGKRWLLLSFYRGIW